MLLVVQFDLALHFVYKQTLKIGKRSKTSRSLVQDRKFETDAQVSDCS